MPLRALLTRATVAVAIGLGGTLAAAAFAAATPYAGVQLHSLWRDSTNADMDRELALAAQAHSNVVRVDVGWGSLEPTAKGQFDDAYVQKLDRFMAGATAQGMKVIIMLWGTPCWASSAPDSVKQGCSSWDNSVVQYAPNSPRDYADVALWITSRYGSQMASLEVWNEPNNGTFWKSGPAAYAELVKAAYPAAKAGSANVPVLAGSLSGADTDYLHTLYADGILGSEDGIAVHPYQEGPSFPGLASLHTAMLAAGDTNPVWVTEFGWPTGSDPNWSVSDTDQATNIANAFNDLATLPWVQGSVLYNLRDKGIDAGNSEDNYGVVRRDFSPKPGYQALSDVLAQIDGQGAATAPAVTVTSPVNNSTIGSSIRVAAQVLDALVVSGVTFAVDGKVSATELTPPYATTISTTGLSTGLHTVTATSYDAAGRISGAAVLVGKGLRIITTAVTATTPTVTITSSTSATGPTAQGALAGLISLYAVVSRAHPSRVHVSGHVRGAHAGHVMLELYRRHGAWQRSLTATKGVSAHGGYDTAIALGRAGPWRLVARYLP